MSEEKILEKLHEIILDLGIESRKCDGDFEGGIIRINNRLRLMLNSNLLPAQEIEILCQELSKFDLSNIFLLPVLRKEIEHRS